MDKVEITKELEGLEVLMYKPDFWSDSKKAQDTLRKIDELKVLLVGGDRFDAGNCFVSVYAGVGGDDAEDFVRILFEMYSAFCDSNSLTLNILDKSPNNLNGFKNIAFEVVGKGAYGKLKSESGVHRLVRKSPFNAKGKRQTSFALVDAAPEVKSGDFDFDESALEVSFAKSSGAGGQNVNKRETAVRVTDPETKISIFVSEERTQERNRVRAMEIMRSKLYKKHQVDERKKAEGLSISKEVKIEWGSQMRSYVFDPYQMVKDHERGIEVRNVDKVLGGDISMFSE